MFDTTPPNQAHSRALDMIDRLQDERDSLLEANGRLLDEKLQLSRDLEAAKYKIYDLSALEETVKRLIEEMITG